jgi:nitrite reductase (NADH) small subunit
MTSNKVWLRIAYCGDIPPREGRSVRIGSSEIAIFNLGSRFLAVENRCPHRGGPLADGIVSGTAIVCPLHAWKFSLESGKGVSAPSQASCVSSYRTHVENEIVWLEVPAETAECDPTLPQACAERAAGSFWDWSHSLQVVDEL